MTGPARSLVAALREASATLPDLAARLQYPMHRVLGFITEARAAGVPIIAVRDPSISGVPALAKPEPDAWTTVYTVRDD